MPEVIHRRVVFGADCSIRHVDAEEDLDVIAEVLFCHRPSLHQGRVDLGSFFNIAVDLRFD